MNDKRKHYTVTRERLVTEEQEVLAEDENDAREVAHGREAWRDNFESEVLDTEPSDYVVELTDEN